MTAGKKQQKTKKPKKKGAANDIDRTSANKDKNILEAHKQADQDIEQDADLGIHSPNDDLDEGETARLEDDKII